MNMNVNGSNLRCMVFIRNLRGASKKPEPGLGPTDPGLRPTDPGLRSKGIGGIQGETLVQAKKSFNTYR